MKAIDKQPANAAFRKVSGMVSTEMEGKKTRGASSVRRGQGVFVLVGVFAFALLAFGALVARIDIADARQKAEGPELVSSIEALRIADSSDIPDISAVRDIPVVAMNAGEGVGKSAEKMQSIAPSSGDVAPAPDAPPAPDSPVVETVPEDHTPPPAAPLVAPEKAPAADEAQGQAQTQAVTRPDVAPGDDSYYDSLPLPPSGPLAKKTAGPREVDPKLEPASKFVVVTRDQDANGFEALLVSANRALALGRYDAAVDLFEQLLRKNSRDRRAMMGHAVALQKAGRGEAARGAYEALLKLDPDNREAQTNLLGLIAQDYPAVALRRMLDLRKKWPQDAGLAAQIGLTQARLGNDRDALDYLGMAASIDPSNAGHLFNMAVVADRIGDKDQAIELYEQALQVDTLHGGGRSVPRDTIYSRLSVLRDQ